MTKEKICYSVDAQGRFWRSEESSWIELPCEITARAFEFNAICKTPDDLRDAITRIHAHPSSRFQLSEILEWALDTGPISGFIRPSKYRDAARGTLPTFEGF